MSDRVPSGGFGGFDVPKLPNDPRFAALIGRDENAIRAFGYSDAQGAPVFYYANAVYVDVMQGQMDVMQELVNNMRQHDRYLVEYTSIRKAALTTHSTGGLINKAEAVQAAAKYASMVLMTSLLIWICSGIPVINPFVAVLLLAACPFFYVMGKKIS